MKNRTWAEIDIDNLTDNLQKLKKLMPENTGILAAVKANAYGHDSIEISRVLHDDISMFGVASIDEAVELRENGIGKPIVILSPTFEGDIDRIIKNSITPNVVSYEYAAALDRRCSDLGCRMKIHIEVDTGMHRTGIDFDSAEDEVCRIAGLKNIEIEGIFSHFAEAEKEDDAFTIEQIRRYDIIINKLKSRRVPFKYMHISNSSAIVNAKGSNMDMVRPGIMLYGNYTSSNLKNKIDIKPVMRLKTRIGQIKHIKAGDSVSYSRTFTADRDMTIAAALIGYADGYSRLLSNKARMFVNGKFAPVVGAVCMDLTMIDITGIDNVRVGDEIEVFGENVSVDELAEITGNINYEILTGIGPRVPRIFYRNDEVYLEKNILAQANGRDGNGR